MYSFPKPLLRWQDQIAFQSIFGFRRGRLQWTRLYDMAGPKAWHQLNRTALLCVPVAEWNSPSNRRDIRGRQTAHGGASLIAQRHAVRNSSPAGSPLL